MTEQTNLTKELATRINRLVNIPLINEQNEQIFFEFVVGVLLEMLFDEIDLQLL